jgi:hypothetical protein
MSPETLFNVHLVLGYVVWLLCFGVYIWPRLKAMDRIEAQRAIATLHSFRFFGLVFILPGVAGNLPTGFADFAAYGDFAAGLLAILALLTVRMRPLFWLFVVAFNVVGAADLIGDYYHATTLTFQHMQGVWRPIRIPILYVPLLMITTSPHLLFAGASTEPAKAAEGNKMPAAPSSERRTRTRHRLHEKLDAKYR